MDNNNIIDAGAALGLFLFTGAEVIGIESTIFEIISKFGVVAVLWFWLREMKQQIKDMMLTFDKETTELRTEHKENLDRVERNHERQMQLLSDQVKIIKNIEK